MESEQIDDQQFPSQEVASGRHPDQRHLLVRSTWTRDPAMNEKARPRLTLSELDAIPYLTETGYRLNPEAWERVEQLDALRFIRADHRVLELGGCYGLVSCVINHRLEDQSKHVVVEPAMQVIDALQWNRETHLASFHVYNGVVALKSAVLRGEGLGRWTESADDGPVPHLTVEAIEECYEVDFNCLVADCEGALQLFVQDFPDFFDKVDTFLYERDREWDGATVLCDYPQIERFLQRKEFRQLKSGSHCVWVRR